MPDSTTSAKLVLARLLAAPGAEDLRTLQGLLLAASADARRRTEAERALALAGELHEFLSELESKLGARAFSQFASLLDIGAVGAVALETLSDPSRRKPLSVGLAALGEGLMVLASRQYVKAWQCELGPLMDRSIWRCREALWRLSAGPGPDLDPAERLAAIDGALAPAGNREVEPESRHALVARLLQLLVVATAMRALDGEAVPAEAPAPTASPGPVADSARTAADVAEARASGAVEGFDRERRTP